jgi:hypothetical protein
METLEIRDLVSKTLNQLGVKPSHYSTKTNKDGVKLEMISKSHSVRKLSFSQRAGELGFARRVMNDITRAWQASDKDFGVT